ncbi:rhodanese-related sulfurtransferase [Agrococcus sp. UYP33]
MREIQPAEVGTMPIVDVREQHEWDAGHAVDAIHIPMSEVVARLDEVPDGAAVICRSGARSGQVVAYLAQQGRDAANVAGGTLQWAAEGRPMVGSVL